MQRLLDQFRAGETIYLPGATGEIVPLTQALAAEPDRMRGVTVLSCLVPGINRFDYAALDDSARLTTFMLSPALRSSFDAGRIKLIPACYSAIARHMRDRVAIDTAVAHVAPPDADGMSSLGIAADFSPIAWRAARRRVAIVNPAMPAMRRGPRIRLKDADIVLDGDSGLLEVESRSASAEAAAIACRAAALIPDGAAIQLGIGGASAAICDQLTLHRGLRLRSGMAPEAAWQLAEAGALADPDTHHVGIAAGSDTFYRFLGESDLVGFADTGFTHDAAMLRGIERFHAINGALEVDLMGQVNLEYQDGRSISGVGGAPDFARAAAVSPGGRSLVLLPSTARGGQISRIVARINAPTVSLARGDVDTVVTEWGTAELRDLSLDDRARALIAVADERYRDDLARCWRDIRTGL